MRGKLLRIAETVIGLVGMGYYILLFYEIIGFAILLVANVSPLEHIGRHLMFTAAAAGPCIGLWLAVRFGVVRWWAGAGLVVLSALALAFGHPDSLGGLLAFGPADSLGILSSFAIYGVLPITSLWLLADAWRPTFTRPRPEAA
jgi:hypothetical protein